MTGYSNTIFITVLLVPAIVSANEQAPRFTDDYSWRAGIEFGAFKSSIDDSYYHEIQPPESETDGKMAGITMAYKISRSVWLSGGYRSTSEVSDTYCNLYQPEDCQTFTYSLENLWATLGFQIYPQLRNHTMEFGLHFGTAMTSVNSNTDSTRTNAFFARLTFAYPVSNRWLIGIHSDVTSATSVSGESFGVNFTGLDAGYLF